MIRRLSNGSVDWLDIFEVLYLVGSTALVIVVVIAASIAHFTSLI